MNAKVDLGKIVYEKSINNNICFKSRDIVDEVIIKIESLHTISVQNLLSTKCYINSIETNDYRGVRERIETLNSLKECWGVGSKLELIEIIDLLLADEKEIEGFDAKDFLEILSRNKIYIPKLKDKKYTMEAYNIQRAILVLREGLSCNLITLEEYNEIKLDIFQKIKKYFECSNLNEFIFEYLLGCYNFFINSNEVDDGIADAIFDIRVEGIRVLLENHYFDSFKLEKTEDTSGIILLENLQVLAGVHYEKNKRVPFEGVVESKNLNGELEVRHHIKYVRFNGVSQYYSSKGVVIKMVKYESGRAALGEFIYNKETNCFELIKDSFEGKVHFSIENDVDLDKEKSVEICCSIYKDLDKWIEKVGNYFFENLVEIANEDWLDEDEKIEKRDIESTLKKKFGIYIEYPEEITIEFFIRNLWVTVVSNLEGDIIRGEFS